MMSECTRWDVRSVCETFQSENLNGRNNLIDPGVDGIIILKVVLNMVLRYRLGSPGAGQGPVASACDHGQEGLCSKQLQPYFGCISFRVLYTRLAYPRDTFCLWLQRTRNVVTSNRSSCGSPELSSPWEADSCSTQKIVLGSYLAGELDV